ncbi:ECF transporter S component [Bacillus aquiflavi]|uniref:ECF transporter S component n=1 Tax=Bacillus aquiflavi TaxID=2672567 RepID=A0A6B3W0X8_9BACI|nr:ECF transporter S component [Bacillus aquiflavi]MBA4536847.1 ECF transporter S component [Bacillus aquiflavi]NEY81214.1 ECF transporter S component [Bacillus aquiflavi]UAC48476.1 ECF transporter S component [Bacillus aquiflavi]
MTGRKLSWIALFIALSTIGAAIKIPALVGSVALDVFPALFASAMLGGGLGALIGALGHLLSAVIVGMPLGAFHFIIALEMAFLVWVFGSLYNNGKRKSAAILFILGNTFAAPLPFLFMMGKAFYIGIVPSLLIGSILNVIVAIAVIPRLSPVFKMLYLKGETK